MSATWHADDELFASYVRGDADALRSASLEQHLIHCETCRSRIAQHVEPRPLELVWDRIREDVQAPAHGPVERFLARLGLPESDALVISAASSLRVSWLWGVVLSLTFVGASVAWGGTRGLALFLAIAPLVPVVGVAFAYGPAVDDTYELAVASPYSGPRLLLLRTAAVLVTSIPLVLVVGLLAPGLSWTAVTWLLPASAFTVVVLAAATWVPATDAAAVLMVAWVCAVGAAAVRHDPAAVVDPAVLPAYVLLAGVAAVVLRRRIRHLTVVRRLP
ncbi:hypothetical protein Cch01nite_09360 [Cellulomonas chitinilytica]|uniref:Zinc-finger domain-containing protein n=1 Tax=Cellulomonas chitinilytica TaxID=398759 RepID=A0A919U166_9CELL|nr:hypothetical protein [Cellulomonas chitinilytica]GIG20212.1 hypothetical protein Cch01nite_09360 [Cellulomonas chitinilytica]